MSLPPSQTVVQVFGREGDHASGTLASVVWLDHEASARELASTARAAGTPICSFLQPGLRPRARFFTTKAELPLCGAGALAAGAAEASRSRHALVNLVIEAGDCAIDCTQANFAHFVLRGRGTGAIELNPDPLLAALAVTPSELEGVNGVMQASVGSCKWLVRVRNGDILRRLQPDMAALAQVSESANVNGAYVYTTDETGSADVLARGFNPRGGVDEDPATGSAAAALAWTLREELQGRWLIVDQGIGLQHLNRIHTRIQPDEIHIGGRVVFT
jgi:PhzF family phenazine biosynthesis protein